MSPPNPSGSQKLLSQCRSALKKDAMERGEFELATLHIVGEYVSFSPELVHLFNQWEYLLAQVSVRVCADFF